MQITCQIQVSPLCQTGRHGRGGFLGHLPGCGRPDPAGPAVWSWCTAARPKPTSWASAWAPAALYHLALRLHLPLHRPPDPGNLPDGGQRQGQHAAGRAAASAGGQRPRPSGLDGRLLLASRKEAIQSDRERQAQDHPRRLHRQDRAGQRRRCCNLLLQAATCR